MTVARLNQAAALLEHDSPQLAGWLRQAIAEIEAGSSADQALELRGREALRRRNQFLCQAARLTASESLWGAAGELNRIIRSMGRRRPGRPLTAVEATVQAAEECGRLPSTRKQLFNVLAREHAERSSRLPD